MSDDDGQESEKQEEDVADNEKKNKKKRMKKKKQNGILSSTLNADVALTDVYVDVNPLGKVKSHKKGNEVQQRHAEPEIMKKSVISDDYEKQNTIQTTHVSVRQQKKERRLEREKTKGSKWFNMPATELTEERKYDLAVLQMRKVLDPKRFYKSHDLKAVPKYFQFGEVVEDATDFYSSRIPKKQRKSTVVEELLADAEFRKFNKRKYEEVQEAKRHGKGPYKHMKRLKKRKK
ncbi:deoxynucleotidyltransferase terminal-interacting protein 2-like [Ruditapes philippinarum]|uniref:deoxynucleotidyltransferase terminal-interacting protein 2-like n=1 Tax=Ruditapes philippinarum TaxID=129788 RepID=UPI00295C30FE|nr:deoxynucleotidyltransferase terminal-interacting protein 2-like [Ruditapes philippinarum]